LGRVCHEPSIWTCVPVPVSFRAAGWTSMGRVPALFALIGTRVSRLSTVTFMALRVAMPVLTVHD
jgi:hypothetical protein